MNDLLSGMWGCSFWDAEHGLDVVPRSRLAGRAEHVDPVFDHLSGGLTDGLINLSWIVFVAMGGDVSVGGVDQGMLEFGRDVEFRAAQLHHPLDILPCEAGALRTPFPFASPATRSRRSK